MNTESKFEPNDKLHEEMHAQIKKIHSTNCDYVNADVLHQYIDEIYMAAKSNHIPDTGKMVAALRSAKEFIENGIELGFIRMPEVDHDPAHKTLPMINDALSSDHIAEAGKMIAPEFDAGLIADYANLQTSGAIPCANRYSAADAVEQAELIEKAAVDHSVDANKKVSTAAIAQDEYPKVSFVLSHKHTCANVQPGSTIDTPCDCGAIVDGKAVKVEPQRGGAQ